MKVPIPTMKQIQKRIRESSARCDALRKKLGLKSLPKGFEILEPNCVNAQNHVPLPTAENPALLRSVEAEVRATFDKAILAEGGE